jgi:hypothetical protein
MTISREEFEGALASLRVLTDAVAQHTLELKIQFERIAQIQAELDSSRGGSQKRSRQKKSPTVATAADAGRPDERRSHPR